LKWRENASLEGQKVEQEMHSIKDEPPESICKFEKKQSIKRRMKGLNGKIKENKILKQAM